MPVRSPRHISSDGDGGKRNIIGYFPSVKMRRNIQFESTIELDYCYILDYDKNVLSFEEQPLVIEGEIAGKRRKYTPDFRVQHQKQKDIIVECKPFNMIDVKGNQQQFEIGRKWCEQEGLEYKIITDKELRTGHKLANIKVLWRFARQPVTADAKAYVFGLLNTAIQPLTIAELASKFTTSDFQAAMRIIYHMAYYQHVLMLIDSVPLNLETLVVLPHQRHYLE